jgi:hypothetical protein
MRGLLGFEFTAQVLFDFRLVLSPLCNLRRGTWLIMLIRVHGESTMIGAPQRFPAFEDWAKLPASVMASRPPALAQAQYT